MVELAKENLHPELEWLGVVLNIADLRTRPLARGARAAARAVRRQGLRHRDPPVDPLRRVGRARRLDPRLRAPTSAPTTSRSATRCSSASAGAPRRRASAGRVARRSSCPRRVDAVSRSSVQPASSWRAGPRRRGQLARARRGLARADRGGRPALNAFDARRPRRRARGGRRGRAGDERPFAGVPIAIKDLGMAVAGLPLTICSDLFGDFTPDYDGYVVRRFREAGLRHRRQDADARVRHPAGHRAAPLRPHPQPVGHRAHPGRLLGRLGRRGGRRAWCRSPTPATAAARSASRPPAAAWSA